jgi:hypothetical protein
MKKSNIQGKLKKYRRSGFRAMVIKVPWKKTPGYCCSYVSDTSTSAVSKTCVSSFSKLFGKIHKQHTFSY